MHDLGFVSAILADRGVEEIIEFASRNNFKCVELMCWPKGKAERRYAGVTHIDADALSDKLTEALQRQLQENNVYISGLGYYPNPLDPDLEKASVYIAHLKQVIKAAARLGVPVVNTFIGRDYTKNIDENFTRFEKVWPEIVRIAEGHGINIGIENCPMFFTGDEWPGGKNLAISPAIWERMFTLIPSKNFGLNYDPSHMILQQMDYVQPLYTFKDRLHHIHLKDAKLHKNKLNQVGILATPLEYHSPKLPGLGDVHWGSFFGGLTDTGYRGPVCIEVEDRAFEGSAADRETALLTSRNYLSQFLR